MTASSPRPLIVSSALFFFPRVAAAHPGRAPEPHDLWHLWSFAPAVVVTLVASAVAYYFGVRRFRAHAGRGRTISLGAIASFAGGLAAIAIALLSPIDAVSEALFSVHMTQHLLLVVVAAPLLVLGEPGYVMMWALAPATRRTVAAWWLGNRTLRRSWRAVSSPTAAWSIHVVTLWLWHVPRLYDAALGDERIHILEHVTFLLTALLFWWVVLDRHRLRVGVATIYLFVAALQSTLFGALLTLARHPWYAGHAATTAAWGLSPLEDQQLAGLIMWIPAGLAYLLALVPRLAHALRESGATTRGAPADLPTSPAGRHSE